MRAAADTLTREDGSVSYGRERVLSHFDAYDADGTPYMIEEYVSVHDWVQGEHIPVEWTGLPQLRLADRTPVERGPRDRFWFRDARGRYIDLTLHDPREK
jgi:hypothetical protein